MQLVDLPGVSLEIVYGGARLVAVTEPCQSRAHQVLVATHVTAAAGSPDQTDNAALLPAGPDAQLSFAAAADMAQALEPAEAAAQVLEPAAQAVVSVEGGAGATAQG